MKPEQRVLDQIDELVDESLGPGPRDDFNVDRYPRCDHCDHGWHGLGCVKCDCAGSEGERASLEQRKTYFDDFDWTWSGAVPRRFYSR